VPGRLGGREQAGVVARLDVDSQPGGKALVLGDDCQFMQKSSSGGWGELVVAATLPGAIRAVRRKSVRAVVGFLRR
jgi:hypothetical protein